MTTCPYCGSDDLEDVTPHKTVCIPCEATCVMGLWAPGASVRRMRAAIDDADRRLERE